MTINFYYNANCHITLVDLTLVMYQSLQLSTYTAASSGVCAPLTKPQPIMLNFYLFYAFEQCSKNLPFMLNIMSIITAIMPHFVYDFIIC